MTCRLFFIALICMMNVLPAQAALQLITHWSDALQKEQTYRVYVPDDANAGKKYPVLYVLHGATEWWDSWVTYSSIGEAAKQYRMIIVFPHGGAFGWYLDSPVEPQSQYETYVTRELIADVESRFPTLTGRSNRAIMGNSMGGHGAMTLSAKNPHLYGSASATAGILRIQNHWWKWQIANRLGSLQTHPDRWAQNSAYDLAHLFRFNNVRIMFDCGSQDEVGATVDNRQFHERLNALNVPHVYNEVWWGRHDWNFWNAVLHDHLKFHQGIIDEARASEFPSGYSPTWYLAEGATHPGFDTFVLLANPNPDPIRVKVDFLTEGAGNTATEMSVGGRSRVTLNVGDYVPNAAVSMVLNELNGKGFAVESAMYSTGGGGWYGGHAALGIRKARNSWFLAEGASSAAGPADRNFETYLLVANADSTPTDVQLTFFVEGMGSFDRIETIPANSRRTFLANESYDSRLRSASFSTRVNAIAGRSIIVERAMWWNAANWPGQSFMEGNASPGLNDLSTEWYLAEGNSGDGFDDFILIANPNPFTVWITVRYLLEGAGPQTRDFQISANQRKTVNVRWDAEGVGSASRHGTVVLASAPIAVERSMYRSEGTLGWVAGHNGLGSPRAAFAWALPEGATVPVATGNLRTEVLIANPQSDAANATLLFLLDNGTNFELQRNVPGNQRITVVANDIPELQGRAFSTIVSADRAIVVERSMYWGMSNPMAVSVAGGTASMGIPLAYTAAQAAAMDLQAHAQMLAPIGTWTFPTITPTPTVTPTPVQ